MKSKPCGAKKRSGDGTCQKPGTGVGGRCRLHGGASPEPGPGHPTWKHGRASQMMLTLPKHLREGFLTSINDPDILSVRSELGVIDSRVMELIERITTGESQALFTKIVDLASSIRAESKRADPDVGKIADDADELQHLLDARVNDEKNWADIRDTIESRRRLTDTERKLLEMKQATVDSKQLHAIITLILQSIANNVLPLEGGKVAVNNVSGDIRKLLQMN